MEFNHFPVAIVGIGCRMPGSVKCPDDFWKVIHDGTNTISEIPPHRWSLDNYYHPDQTKQGKMVTRRCGFIDDVDKFDNTYFKISPREAMSMDPQQRHILEVVSEAFEDAGIVPESVSESTGVYLGIGMMDYPIQSLGDTSILDAYTITGSAHSVAANRVSYAFDLKGPSYAVDTACASSMTAMHLACTGLWNGECNVAVLGGCNNLLMPEVTVGFSALGVLSPEGQCCPFSSSAKGYVRSEGFGALILKPLAKAMEDYDHIYAVVRGSAIAANGFCNSLTMPSLSAQKTVMEQAYHRFGVPLSSVYCIEAHGTGTPVGDPIEAEAIGKTFAPHRDTPLRIGSVKSNFGHNECAAGVTAAIKVALMLDKKMLCPTINFVEPNPHIKTDEWKLQVQTQLEPLPDNRQVIIGLNSFGFAGAVAHMIFQEAPVQAKPKDETFIGAQWSFGSDEKGTSILIPLSAKSNEALTAVAENWKNYASEKDALKVVSWLATRRKHHECRLAVITSSGQEFQKQMTQFIQTGSAEGLSSGSAYGKNRKICMIFPGQGQQWGNMGRQLYRKEAVFRQKVQECDAIFAKLSGWSLLHDKLFFNGLNATGAKQDADKLINDMEISQPAILFFQIALFHLWQYWGIIPDAVVGHSLGEVAAAYACGGLTLEEAIAVIYHRSTQQAKVKGAGSMAALRLPLKEAKDICDKTDKLYVAAINAPAAITIAGDTEFIADFAANNPTVAKQLRVQCAFHTPEMDPMEKSFRAAMKGVVQTEAGNRSIPLYSTVTGRLYEGDFGTKYWWNNIRNTVQFQSAVEEILEETEADIFLECGASATLISCVNQIAKRGKKQVNITSIASGQRQQDDHYMALKALGALYTAGVSINWKNVTGNCAEWVSLPTYPWQHQSFWVEAEHFRKNRLGLDDRSFKGQRGNLSLMVFPFLADHVVQNRLVFPGAGYVEYAIESIFPEKDMPSLSQVSFSKLLMWPEESDVGGSKHGNVQLDVNKEGTRLQIMSQGALYSSAEPGKSATMIEHICPEDIVGRCTAVSTGDEFYERLVALGLQYGPTFQVIDKIAIGDGEVLGYLRPAPVSKQRLQITHLDGCFQLLISALGDTSTLYLPVAIKSLQMHVPSLPASEPLIAHAQVTECDSMVLRGNIILASENGKVLVKIDGCECQNVTGTSSDVDLASCLYTTEKQIYKSALPPTSIAEDIFQPHRLEQLFPEEMGPVSKAVELVPLITSVCVSYIRHALTVVPHEEREKCNPRYLKRLQDIAADETVASIPYEDIPKTIDEIMERVPEMKQELNMVTALGNNLPTTLRDPSTAVSILFAAENIAHYFIDSLSTRLYYKAGAAIIERAVRETLTKKPFIRVLEVGGRMGGLTSYVAKPLKEFGMNKQVEYIFTDLSASFFAHAEGRLQDYPFVKYQQLDIEMDIQSQGFAPGSVDIVICMDTIHSTVDLNNGLTQMRNLLCPDGWLLMYESTNSRYITELLFGALDLCWIFQDFRTDVCWLDQKGWVNLMEKGGFRDVTAVSSPGEYFHSIMLGRKSEQGPDLGIEVVAEPNWVVISDSTFSGSGKVIEQTKKDLPENTRYKNFDMKLEDALKDLEYACLVYVMGNADWKAHGLINILHEVHTNPNMCSRVIVVTTGSMSEAAVAVGLIRAATNQCQTPLFSIHLEDEKKETLETLMGTLLKDDIADRETSICRGEVCVPRLLMADISTHDTSNEKYWQLSQGDAETKNASIDDMGFSYLCELDPPPGKVVVRVKAAALNFKDVMMALGLLSGLDEEDDRNHFGLECSGVVEKIGAGVSSLKVGDHVVGFGKHCFASHTISDAKVLVPKPSELNWIESAGITVVFATAYYSLVERANLRSNETVLIHSACGGVGLAAIQVAKMLGARIICSAGSEKKRVYLREEIGIELVTDSRSERFYDDVMEWTDGEGVDVVLNSLSGNLLLKGIECLALGGRFCEIGKRDILQKSNLLIMPLLLENKSVLSCQIDRLVRHQKSKAQSLLMQVTSLFDKGVLRPISTATSPISSFAETFRGMAKASHIGKVVFSIPEDFRPTRVLPTSNLFKVNATYVVTGGYGGLGQAFARWVCKKGARHVALVSRRGCQTAAARRTIAFMKRKGVKVYEFALDLSDASKVQTMLRQLVEVHNAPIVRGIFHLAGFIAEESLSILTPELMDKVLGAKASSARHLHDQTSSLPLDFFFMLSSVTAVWGHSSQPCYTAANVYLDELAQERRNKDLPATSLQLGPVRGAGYLESNVEVVKTLGMKGNLTLHVEEVLQVVGQILQAKDAPAVLCLAKQDWDATLLHCHNDSLKFRHLTLGKQLTQTDCSLSQEDIEDRVRQKMGQLLCVEPGSIDLRQPMINYGIDSLMAVEMVTWASKELNVIISQLDILGGICTNVLLERALDHSVVINVAE